MKKQERQITITEYVTTDGKVFSEDRKEKAIFHQSILDGEKKYCDNCNGHGKVWVKPSGFDMRTEASWEECQKCKGKGYLTLQWS